MKRATTIIPSRHVLKTTALAVSLLWAGSASALELDTGDSDIKLRWDNTLKYSAAWRTHNPDSTLTARINQDDGDRNFKKGLISDRWDLLSELDASYHNFGVRVSGAAWHDAAYLGGNDNPGGAGGALPNQSSVGVNQFTSATRHIHGQGAEFLDAFAYGKFDLGDSRATVRAGKHSLVWGETLFFGANGIAGGMMPVDVVKLMSVPNTQFKEAIRPVQMLSGQLQLTPEVSLGAYYQYRWQASRLPASGSYFSSTDAGPEGGERLWIVPPGAIPAFVNPGANANGIYATRADTQKARDSGQGGIQLRFRDEDTDYGLYAIRFHDKTHQLVPKLGIQPVIGVAPVSYNLVYHEDITAYGGSFSRTFGEANVAGEVSFRNNQDLATSSAAVDASALTGGTANNNSDNPAYAVGNTAHANLSVLWNPSPSVLFPESTLVGEVAWNRVLHITKNANLIAPRATRDAVALRMTFEPTYRQVLPGLDMGVPLGVGFSPKASRSMALGPGAMPSDGGGDVSLGLNFTYLASWYASVAFTHYYGPKATFLDGNNDYTYKQNMKDRDFIAMSIRHTF
ncbi:MAG TPA: DUF1302 domain-containing protein [Rhodocyclaceae bacterium]|nr:DUF1302 domain-containing protein [Rhodocyclaceae bacterium]